MIFDFLHNLEVVMKKLKLFKTGIKGKRQKYRLKKDADQILKYGTKHFLKAKKKNKD